MSDFRKTYRAAPTSIRNKRRRLWQGYFNVRNTPRCDYDPPTYLADLLLSSRRNICLEFASRVTTLNQRTGVTRRERTVS